MLDRPGRTWAMLPAVALLLACGDAPYEPTPERLLGEFAAAPGQVH
jgi:hypothetical protein